MPERIFLTYTNATGVPCQGSTLGHQLFSIMTTLMVIITRFKESRSARFQHNLDKASAFVREEVLSDGAINTDSPFGRLRSPPQHIDRDVSSSGLTPTSLRYPRAP